MLIILNVLPHVPCAQFHAIADDYEAPYITTRHIKFWHNDRANSLTFDKAPDVFHGDHYITFHSDMPFAEFCWKLEKSEYNNPSNYHFLRHNCAHGSAFALKTAGIDLDIPNYKIFNRVGDRFNDYISGFSFSPLDLLDIAKAHKLKTQPAANMDFKFDLARSSLLFWAKKSGNQTLLEKTEQLIAENDADRNLHPEHSAMNLCVLLATIDLIQNPDRKNHRDYLTLARHHRKRPYQPPTGSELAFTFDFVSASFALAILRVVLEKTVLTAPIIEQSWLNALIGGVVGGATYHGLRWFLNHQDKKAAGTSISDTPLSKAMNELKASTPNDDAKDINYSMWEHVALR